VDYDHATLRPGQQAIAAGWISRLEVRNAGAELWAKVRWNSQASEFLGRREYRYLSPVFRFEYPDPVTGRKWPAALESVALTNTPFLTELPAVANQSGRTAGETDPAAQSEEGGMKDLLKLLGGIWANSVADAARFLGLAENAADEDVLKAVAAKAKDAAANKAGADRAAVFANALGVKPDADDKAISTTIAALKAPALSLAVVANALGLAPDSKPEDMAKQISDLRGQAADTKAERLIANAVEGKKIPPALRDWWIKRAKEDLPGTETIVNALPAILSEPSRGAAGSAPIVNLTDSETALANSLGVAQSDFAADKAEFSRSRELQDEFRSVETYLAYRGAERQGRVRVVGATKV
jgi:phage I-like protein